MSLPRVAAAVSGGVDSAVAVRLLQEAGYAVEAWHLMLCRDAPDPAVGPLCETLGVPLHILDLRGAFERLVKGPFFEAYAHGETPNPCALCNPRIKFGLLAEAVGPDVLLATGHYAAVGTDPVSGRVALRRAADAAKDQSYFLYALPPAVLPRLRFPLAGLTRADTVALAQRLGLPIPQEKLASGSQDICFLPGGDYRPGLAERHPETQRAGDILDPSGRVIGRHTGLGNYTRGQRRGLGVACGGRVFVTGFDRARNTLTLGPKRDLEVSAFRIREANWFVPPTFPLRCEAVSRYRHPPFACAVEADGTVRPDEPQTLVTPGQACVFYRGPWVLGGGVIDSCPGA